MHRISFTWLIAATLALVPSVAGAQVSPADYERAQGLRERWQYLTANVPEPATWVPDTTRFFYRKSVRDGHEFVRGDAATGRKGPAFDHQRLASSLSTAMGSTVTAARLPFTTFEYTDGEAGIRFLAENGPWECRLADYSCSRRQLPTARRGPLTGNLSGIPGPVRDADRADAAPRRSPDGKWEAVIRNFNIAVRAVPGGVLKTLTGDGSEGDYYELASIVWSPDSRMLAAYRIRPGYRRQVTHVESSPEDQLQPKRHTVSYAKPGDVLDVEQPVIVHLDPVRSFVIARELFPSAYELSPLVWRRDSRAVTFEYNQRGHEVYRVLEVDAASGTPRAVISEEPQTFFYYGAANHSRSSGKRFRHDVADGREVVWMSERSGWNHLYLYDGVTGRVKNQITTGDWPVRGVERVDEKTRQIWFSASGLDAGKDPYLLQYFRINFDGTGLTRLTSADADHILRFSTDMSYFVDTYSRIDLAPVSELRRSSDGSLVMELERGDLTGLTKAGWTAPEVFSAKGRDRTTDIWGIIIRPSTFDPSKKYPVIESIYAGPHGSHVPKSFTLDPALHAQAELGFIVVQIDGMGTSNRSKAFHDVAWKNLGDAGFPDRILWHKAAAARYPSYDITRVGIYGGSAGGQNSLGALLFHPEFYKVAVSYAGCHDNRMDKIWWNEQWMGYPIGPHYSASSNVDNAGRLQGRVLLVVGELDTNVDPSSTMQVVSALIRANKEFDLLVVPGGDHGAGRRGIHAGYGERKRFDFFVTHLLGQRPPAWNAVRTEPTATR